MGFDCNKGKGPAHRCGPGPSSVCPVVRYGAACTVAGAAGYPERYRRPKKPPISATTLPARTNQAPGPMSLIVPCGARNTWMANSTDAAIPRAPAIRVSQPPRGASPRTAINPMRIVTAPAERTKWTTGCIDPMYIFIEIFVPMVPWNHFMNDPMTSPAAPARVSTTRAASPAMLVVAAGAGTGAGTAVGPGPGSHHEHGGAGGASGADPGRSRWARHRIVHEMVPGNHGDEDLDEDVHRVDAPRGPLGAFGRSRDDPHRVDRGPRAGTAGRLADPNGRRPGDRRVRAVRHPGVPGSAGHDQRHRPGGLVGPGRQRGGADRRLLRPAVPLRVSGGTGHRASRSIANHGADRRRARPA